MQIVIDIDDNLYTRLFDNGVDNYDDAMDMAKLIRKGVPLPKGHGDLIDRNEIGLTNFDILLCNGDYKEGLKLYIQSVEDASAIIEADTESE